MVRSKVKCMRAMGNQCLRPVDTTIPHVAVATLNSWPMASCRASRTPRISRQMTTYMAHATIVYYHQRTHSCTLLQPIGADCPTHTQNRQVPPSHPPVSCRLQRAHRPHAKQRALLWPQADGGACNASRRGVYKPRVDPKLHPFACPGAAAQVHCGLQPGHNY